jgi:hypothetical protein
MPTDPETTQPTTEPDGNDGHLHGTDVDATEVALSPAEAAMAAAVGKTTDESERSGTASESSDRTWGVHPVR